MTYQPTLYRHHVCEGCSAIGVSMTPTVVGRGQTSTRATGRGWTSSQVMRDTWIYLWLCEPCAQIKGGK